CPDVFAVIGEFVREGVPGAVLLLGVRQPDWLTAEVLVAGGPGGGELALIDAVADLQVDDLHNGLGQVNLDPELRTFAWLRGVVAQADTSFGDERDAVNAFVVYFEGKFFRRVGLERILEVDRVLGELVPGASLVERIP